MKIHHARTERGHDSARLLALPPARRVPKSSDAAHAQHEAIAAVAHELRLPLSHIKGFVTSLRRTDVNWDEETRSEFLADIEVETDRLAQLVESLLATRPTGGALAQATDFAFTQPAAIVQGALHRIRGVPGERQLRLDLPTNLPSVPMDTSQMERVIANLIQNAVKYAPSGTAIDVSARIVRDELEFSVEDEGPGISPEDRERIFEPFFRQQAVQHSYVPGHGLGLAICQSIVLAHGGRIEVSDRPGGGARFSVFLPAHVRVGPFDSSSYQAKDRGDDPAKHSGGRRRGADAQASLQQPQGRGLRGALRSGWQRGVEADRRVPIRPAAA